MKDGARRPSPWVFLALTSAGLLGSFAWHIAQPSSLDWEPVVAQIEGRRATRTKVHRVDPYSGDDLVTIEETSLDLTYSVAGEVYRDSAERLDPPSGSIIRIYVDPEQPTRWTW